MAGNGRARGASQPEGRSRPAPARPSPDGSEPSSRTPSPGVAALPHRLLVFTLDEQRFGLRLAAVEEVVRVVEITPLPKAPDIVLGVFNLRGRVIPVVDIRNRFRLAPRTMTLRDRLIVARTARRPVALLVDAVDGVVESSATAVTAAAEILPGLAYLDGVVKIDDGAILIHDLDTFLSLEEDRALDAAVLSGAEAPDGAA